MFHASNESLDLLRDVYKQAGRPDAIADELTRLHQEHPDDRALLYALADVLNSQGKSAEAQAISWRHPDRLVLGADQVLSCEGRLFHKPEDRRAAESHLAALMGRTHALHSAAVLSRAGKTIETVADSAQLTMRNLSPAA